ncbi:MAG: TonB-dependent receptor [Bacteroidota bacterium]
MNNNTPVRKTALFAVFVLLQCSFGVFGQNLTNHLSDSLASDTSVYANLVLNNEIVVTAQRYESEAFGRPEAISLLNGKQIQSLAPMSMPDAIGNIAGVWMQKTNHGGGSPFIRGFTGYQTLLMIDGIRLNNATFRSGPNQYLNTIDPLMVDRIEVIRGAGAVQYGSDAIGGTAQILTKSPTFSDDGVEVHGQLYGKYITDDMERTVRGELEIAGAKAAVIGGFTYKNFGDLVAGGDLGTLSPTGYTEMSGDLKVRVRLASQNILTIAYQHLRQEDVPLFHKITPRGSFAVNQFDPQQRQLAYARLERAFGHQWLETLKFTVSYQRSLEGRTAQREASQMVTQEEDDVETYGAILEAFAQPKPFWKISSGLEYYQDQVASVAVDFNQDTEASTVRRGLYPDGSQAENAAIYTLHTLDWDKWTVTAGARLNYFSLMVEDTIFGNSNIEPLALVGNLGLVYKLSSSVHLVGALNSAFRAPNINDVSSFGIADFRFEVPNFDLNPEKSTTIEIGAKIKRPRFAGAFYAYQNRLNDLITNVRSTFNGLDSLDGFQVFRRENTNEAVVRGLEGEFEYRHSNVSVSGNITYTYGQNINKDEPLRRIPPLFGRVKLDYVPLHNLALSASWLYAGEQTRLSGGDIDDDRIADGGTPGWHVVNLSARYDYSKNMTVILGFNNVFNEAYRIHGSGVDGMGRSLSLALSVGF